MTRPQIIRADTIDLQDQSAPSAKDHSRQPSHPSAIGVGPAAPHQAETLREVAAEAEEEQARSPRSSGAGIDVTSGYNRFSSPEDPSSLTNDNLDQQDRLAIAQNGGHSGSGAEDEDMGDADEDDDMDDDMMDKISSSPSIDDGGYSLPKIYYPAGESAFSVATPQGSPLLEGSSETYSSSFVETPIHYPVRLLVPQLDSPKSDNNHLPMRKLSARMQELAEHFNALSIEVSAEMADPPPVFVVGKHDDVFEVDSVKYMSVQQDRNAGSLFDDDNPDELSDTLRMTIPYESSEEDDDDFCVPEDSRFIDSGWGGECLQESEDIDFEFVYALHTFVATVEGQANATKGDTMVLLDDSNSYWWLVRVVKDSSIGYLPAEHIETPTERLARLNKHRNIDLSATMLDDRADKPKNPLKKAIRRRTAKTVTFGAPTYLEASDNEYSSDEEYGEGEYYAQQSQDTKSQEAKSADDEIAVVEPLSVRSQIQEMKPGAGDIDPRDKSVNDTAEGSRDSDEILDGKSESKSRIGTVRNTDSFFKDDSVETRKITITPKMLRDDSSGSTARTSNDSSKDLQQRPSIDRLDKEAAAEKGKDGKQKKEKKSGMLSGLFKRKDKKAKLQDEDVDELIYGKKASTEDPRLSPVPSKESEELRPTDLSLSKEEQGPQRNPSKLQKLPRTDVNTRDKSIAGTDSRGTEPRSTEPHQSAAPERVAPTILTGEPSMRLVQPDGDTVTDTPAKNSRIISPEVTKASQSPRDEQKPSGAFSKMLRSRSTSNAEKDPKPEKVKKAKSRIELDDFDSSNDGSPVEEPTEPTSQAPYVEQRREQVQRPVPGAFPDSYISTPAYEKLEPNLDTRQERLSESPVQVSPVDLSNSHPPALIVDTSSQEDPPSPISSPSPDIVDADEVRGKSKGSQRSASGSTTSTSTWSDAHLRTFFDDDGDIKDLLVVVYDKSGVTPAGPDHPITGSLFKDENAKLADITNRLDGMLGDWLARKSKDAGSRK